MARQYLIDNFNWIISDAGGSNLCNEDNDADGVLDDLDRCLNTPEKEVVNEFGCHSLSSENFKIQILGETCPGANNAQLVINAIETNEYIAFINGAEHRFDHPCKAMHRVLHGFPPVCASATMLPHTT